MQVVQHAFSQVILVEETELILHDIDVAIRVGLLDLVQAKVRDPDCPDFTGFFQFLEGADCFSLRGIVVGEVNVENINVVGSQALQTLVDLVRQEFWPVVDNLFAAGEVLRPLSRQDNLVAIILLHYFADQFFGVAQSIDVGCIKQVDSIIQGRPDKCSAVIVLEVGEEVITTHGVGSKTKWGC